MLGQQCWEGAWRSTATVVVRLGALQCFLDGFHIQCGALQGVMGLVYMLSKELQYFLNIIIIIEFFSVAFNKLYI